MSREDIKDSLANQHSLSIKNMNFIPLSLTMIQDEGRAVIYESAVPALKPVWEIFAQTNGYSVLTI
jgi:hypothetical protein